MVFFRDLGNTRLYTNDFLAPKSLMSSNRISVIGIGAKEYNFVRSVRVRTLDKPILTFFSLFLLATLERQVVVDPYFSRSMLKSSKVWG